MPQLKIATKLHGVIYHKTVFIITTMRSQNTLMKWIIECSQPTVTSAASLVQIFWSLHDISADNVIKSPPQLKPSYFCQNFITADNSKQFYCMIWAKGNRNCYLIETEKSLKMHPVTAWFVCAVMPALHLSTCVTCCSVRMKCEVLHLYKWLNLWLCIF